MKFPFFTIGHSNRSVDEFVELLRAAQATLVADIRSFPMSRSNPGYNKDVLPERLASFQVAYEHIAELGGRRGKSKTVPPDVNGFWTHQSFHNYAGYALSKEFRAGLDRLIMLGRAQACVMMCSEAVWWRCHRRIVADHLIARQEEVLHVMGPGRIEPARLSEGAQVTAGDTVIYPR